MFKRSQEHHALVVLYVFVIVVFCLSLKIWLEGQKSYDSVREVNPSGIWGGSSKDGVGVQLPRPPAMPATLRFSAQGKVLVVAMGDCTSCSLTHYTPGDERKNSYDAVLLLTSSAPSEFKKHFPNLKPPYFLLYDKDSRIHQTLHAEFTPRFYEADDSLRIKRAQSDDPTREGFAAPKELVKNE